MLTCRARAHAHPAALAITSVPPILSYADHATFTGNTFTGTNAGCEAPSARGPEQHQQHALGQTHMQLSTSLGCAASPGAPEMDCNAPLRGRRLAGHTHALYVPIPPPPWPSHCRATGGAQEQSAWDAFSAVPAGSCLSTLLISCGTRAGSTCVQPRVASLQHEQARGTPAVTLPAWRAPDLVPELLSVHPARNASPSIRR